MVKIMENPIKMEDLGVPLFSETSISTVRLWNFPMPSDSSLLLEFLPTGDCDPISDCDRKNQKETRPGPANDF